MSNILLIFVVLINFTLHGNLQKHNNPHFKNSPHVVLVYKHWSGDFFSIMEEYVQLEIVFDYTEEVWRDIKGYKDIYQVSNYGRVRRVKSLFQFIRNGVKGTQVRKGGVLKPHEDRKGYFRVSLTKKQDRKTFAVHRLVVIAFVPNPFKKPTVNHKDGNKKNNHASNLEWNTYSENNKHAYENGLRRKFKKSWHPMAKRIGMCDDNYNIIKEFDSIVDADEYIGTSNMVGKAANHSFVVGGYKWKFI